MYSPFLAVVRFGFQGYGRKPMPPVQYLPFCQRKAVSRSLQFCIRAIVSQWFRTIRTLGHANLPAPEKICTSRMQTFSFTAHHIHHLEAHKNILKFTTELFNNLFFFYIYGQLRI